MRRRVLAIIMLAIAVAAVPLHAAAVPWWGQQSGQWGWTNSGVDTSMVLTTYRDTDPIQSVNATNAYWLSKDLWQYGIAVDSQLTGQNGEECPLSYAETCKLFSADAYTPQGQWIYNGIVYIAAKGNTLYQLVIVGNLDEAPKLTRWFDRLLRANGNADPPRGYRPLGQ